MDFRAYAEQKRKEAHKEIIEAICIETNNCADCYNEECRRAECNPCIVKETYPDHIIITDTETDTDLWIEEGFNMDCVYPDYNMIGG